MPPAPQPGSCPPPAAATLPPAPRARRRPAGGGEGSADFFAYPAPKPVVDCVVFRYAERLELLLVRRAVEPFRGRWALPGGAIRLGESPEAAALRKLRAEGGLEGIFLEQLYTFGDPDRDPRGHVVSVAHYALVRAGAPARARESAGAAWHPLAGCPALPFDHDRIVACARERVRAKVRYAPIGFELLGEEFTLGELQDLYEALLGRELDAANFRRDVRRAGVLVPGAGRRGPSRGRPAQLYRFDRDRYADLARRGFPFTL